MNNVRLVTIASLFFSFYISFVNAEVADLSLTIEIDTADTNVIYQQEGTFRLIVTNNGPEAAGTNSALTNPIGVFSGLVELGDDAGEMNFDLDPNVSQNCTIRFIAVDPRPGDPPGFVFVFRTPVIQPNTTVVCHGIYSINFSSGTRTYQWNVNRHIDDIDPDLSNNTTSVTFGVAPQQVRTLNPVGTVIAVILFFMLSIRRKDTNCA